MRSTAAELLLELLTTKKVYVKSIGDVVKLAISRILRTHSHRNGVVEAAEKDTTLQQSVGSSRRWKRISINSISQEIDQLRSGLVERAKPVG